MKNLAFFSGGGSRGVAQVAMFEAALDLNIKFDAFIGVSAGALNASILANYPNHEGVKKLYKLWDSFDIGSGKNKFINVLKIIFVGNIGKVDNLKERVSSLEINDISESKLPLTIITTKLDDLSAVLWRSGNLKDVLLASTAIPGVYPPVMLSDGHYHVDGGVGDIEIDKMISKNFTNYNIYIFDVTGDFSYKEGMNTFDLLKYISAKSQSVLSKKSLENSRVKKYIKLPLPYSEIDPLDFSHTDELSLIGYKIAKAKLS
jgi:NTE family protein